MKIVIMVMICVLLMGCTNPAENIHAGIKLCESNGGIKYFNVNHSVVCNNGAEFSNPIRSLKGLK